MSYTKETLKQSQIKLVVTVTPAEYDADLKIAADRLSARTAIKGFRKGKAPFDIVKKELGDMMILQEALESIVQKAYVESIQKEKMDVVGMPEIHLEKLAPGNDIVFSATVALLPEIKLPDLKKISVKKNKKTIDAATLTETIDAIRGMHATEAVKEGKATGTDKLVINMDMFIDKVPVEGGQAKDYQVYLSEDHYIPGFNKHMEGLEKGEEKQFSLEFPKTHYQKHLAGKTVDFTVLVKDVFERTLPEFTDDFAQKVGQKSAAELQALIQSNLEAEAEQKADQQVEIDMLDALIEKTTFGDLPEVLINAERQKIFYELKSNLERSGITVEQYLKDIKKKEDELFNDFTDQATKRAKAALISREIAKEQHLHAHDDEINKEIELIKAMYKDEQTQERLKRPEVRESIAVMLQNKKVMSWLKEQILAPEKATPKAEEKK